jgi:hypothetical protein
VAENEQTQEQLSRKQLAAWLRRRFEDRVMPDILANLSDDQLIEQYEKNRAEKTKLIAEKTAENDKTKSRAVSKW